MVRKLVIALFFLISVGECQVLARRDSLRVFSYDLVGLNRTGTDLMLTNIANNYLNAAIVDVSNDFPAVVKHRTISITAYVNVYSLDTLYDSVLHCIYKDATTGQRKVLRPVYDPLAWEITTQGRTLPKDSISTTDLPEFVLLTEDSLILHPPPKFNDKLEISYSIIGRQLTADTMTTDIHVRYRELVCIRTAWLMCEDLGLTARADRLKAIYDAELFKSRPVSVPVGVTP